MENCEGCLALEKEIRGKVYKIYCKEYNRMGNYRPWQFRDTSNKFPKIERLAQCVSDDRRIG